jgi:hypothetical protein
MEQEITRVDSPPLLMSAMNKVNARPAVPHTFRGTLVDST